MSTTTTTAGRPVSEPPVAPDLSIADPAPLGLAAFAMTTFVLSIANTNIWGAAAAAAVALALAYGGGTQLLAGMWEFKRNNTFGALAFSSYGAFWISFWYLNVHIAPTLKPTEVPVVLGTYLLGWTVFTAYMTVASLRVSAAVALVFVLLTVTFVLLTIGNFHATVGATTPNSTIKLGGWFGVATAAAAWYASFAGVANSTFRRTILPVYPLAPASRPVV
jgi:succinate-acetate transporter protein